MISSYDKSPACSFILMPLQLLQRRCIHTDLAKTSICCCSIFNIVLGNERGRGMASNSRLHPSYTSRSETASGFRTHDSATASSDHHSSYVLDGVHSVRRSPTLHNCDVRMMRRISERYDVIWSPVSEAPLRLEW